jgi:hypothetical protein
MQVCVLTAVLGFRGSWARFDKRVGAPDFLAKRVGFINLPNGLAGFICSKYIVVKKRVLNCLLQNIKKILLIPSRLYPIASLKCCKCNMKIDSTFFYTEE